MLISVILLVYSAQSLRFNNEKEKGQKCFPSYQSSKVKTTTDQKEPI